MIKNNTQEWTIGKRCRGSGALYHKHMLNDELEQIQRNTSDQAIEDGQKAGKINFYGELGKRCCRKI